MLREKLSHKRLRSLWKKQRRKVKRQAAAKERDRLVEFKQAALENLPAYQKELAEREREERLLEEYEEHERRRRHQLWLEREEAFQKEFLRKQEAKKQLESLEIFKNLPKENEQESRIESCDEEAPNEDSRKTSKEAVRKEVISHLPEANENWHNPPAPQNYKEGQVAERPNCPFFSKTGACRFGERCSRTHARPTVSTTILIRGMYSHFSIEQMNSDDYDTDISLEFEDSETYQHFKDFFYDVLPEFKKIGRVIQFKVCCNHESHLRGNVYIQYSSENEALKSYETFNGRWYAGKQLTCEFANIAKWKTAICGLFFKNACPKGKSCNFLHVFRNPTNEFWAADYDNFFRNRNHDRSSHRNSRSHSRSPSGSPYRSHRSYRRRHSRSRSRSSSPYRRSSRHQRHSSSPLATSVSPLSRHKKRSSHKKKKKHKRKNERSKRSRSPSSPLSSSDSDNRS